MAKAAAEDARPTTRRGPPDDRPPPRTRPLAALLLLGTSMMLVFLLAEAGLHLADYPREPTSHQQLFVEHDPLRGWRNIPGATGRYVTAEYDVGLAYNSHGFRGPAIPYAKPAGTFRVVMLGDSFLEGYTVELADRLPEVLQARLSTVLDTPAVQIIALGTAGYSTDQELLWLESEGVLYDPDLVVLTFGANDVWYNIQDHYWRGAKPVFRRNAGSLVLDNVPVPLPDRAAPDRSLRGWIERNSRSFQLFAAAVKHLPRLHALIIRAGLAQVPPEMALRDGDRVATPSEFHVFRTAPPPEIVEAWRVTDLLIDRMRRTAQSAGAGFMVFLVPVRANIYTMDAAVHIAGNDAEGWDGGAVARRLAETCDARAIPCLDPTDRFRREAAAIAPTGRRLYFRFDWHWNEQGHQLAADILAEAILPRLRTPG